MRLVSYDAGQGPRAGVQPVPGGRIIDAAAALRLAAVDDAPAADGVRGLLAGGPAVLDALGLDNSIARARLLITGSLAAAKLLETGELEDRLAALEAAVRSRPQSSTDEPFGS